MPGSRSGHDDVGSGSEHLLCFLVAQHSTVGSEGVDHARQMGAEPGEQLAALHAAVPGQLVQRIGPERARDIGLRDRLVRAASDPGIDDVALAALLQLLEQIAEPAIEDGAGSSAAENASQRAFEQITQPSAGACAG